MRMLEGLTSGKKGGESGKIEEEGRRRKGGRRAEEEEGGGRGRREAMVCEDFFFIINYLSTIHTSVDDLEFFLQVTKSLDHLRGEGGGGHIHHFSPCPNE